jgi:hypothetical protein
MKIHLRMFVSLSFYDPRPDSPPALVAAYSIHLADCRGEQATESTSKCGGRKKERIALLCFVAAVPHANKIERARKHATLKDAQEESGSEKTGIALNEALEHSDETKAEHANGEPDARLQLLENDIGGYLEQNVRDEEDDESGIVLGALDDVEFFR